MTDDVQVYFNPQCSTCRNGLSLLEDKGVKPTLVKYMDTKVTADELEALVKKLKAPARILLREKDKLYKELGMDDPTLSDRDIFAAIVEHPSLLQRPIIVKGNKAMIGRPIEKMLEIL
ncbi:MAG: arsenate reductase (glutaredoxin) [Proteobacteria bacterium]|nr:arsenate reductase (glutaredoxin) [Pseudomonadota bacterium]